MLTKEMLPAEKIDPRIKRTRQSLMKAFAELLAEKSFESITVQEITDRATVNRATFYAHFEDKYVLLDQAFTETFQQALHSKLPPGSQFSPLNMQLLIQTICEFLQQMYSHCAQSVRTQFDPLVEGQIKRQLYEFLLGWLNGSQSKESNRRGKPELRATISSWGIYGAALRWSQGEQKEPSGEYARQVLPMIMAGWEAQL